MFLDFFPAIQKIKKEKLEELSKISREGSLEGSLEMEGGILLIFIYFLVFLVWEVGQSYSSPDINRKLSASSFVYTHYSIRQRAVSPPSFFSVISSSSHRRRRGMNVLQ